MSSTNPTPFNRQLGAAVRDRRIMAGVTQEQLADAIGVSYQQEQKYESGINRISVEKLVIIANVLGTTPQELIAPVVADDGQELSTTPENQPTERMRLEVMRGLSRIPQKSQRIALDVINALAGEAA